MKLNQQKNYLMSYVFYNFSNQNSIFNTTDGTHCDIFFILRPARHMKDKSRKILIKSIGLLLVVSYL